MAVQTYRELIRFFNNEPNQASAEKDLLQLFNAVNDKFEFESITWGFASFDAILGQHVYHSICHYCSKNQIVTPYFPKEGEIDPLKSIQGKSIGNSGRYYATSGYQEEVSARTNTQPITILTAKFEKLGEPFFFMTGLLKQSHHQNWRIADKEFFIDLADDLEVLFRSNTQFMLAKDADFQFVISKDGMIISASDAGLNKLRDGNRILDGKKIQRDLLDELVSSPKKGVERDEFRLKLHNVQYYGFDHVYLITVKENIICNKLSVREKEIVNFISKGKSNKEVARILNISPNTVRNHAVNIYSKLAVKNRAELVRKVFHEL